MEISFPRRVFIQERLAAAGSNGLVRRSSSDPRADQRAFNDGFRAWTTRGIELGEQEESAAYWRGPLLNNLGWMLHERGADDEALSVFEQALAVREEDRSDEHAIETARL